MNEIRVSLLDGTRLQSQSPVATGLDPYWRLAGPVPAVLAQDPPAKDTGWDSFAEVIFRDTSREGHIFEVRAVPKMKMVTLFL